MCGQPNARHIMDSLDYTHTNKRAAIHCCVMAGVHEAKQSARNSVYSQEGVHPTKISTSSNASHRKQPRGDSRSAISPPDTPPPLPPPRPPPKSPLPPPRPPPKSPRPPPRPPPKSPRPPPPRPPPKSPRPPTGVSVCQQGVVDTLSW
jgi:hypothetical protein